MYVRVLCCAVVQCRCVGRQVRVCNCVCSCAGAAVGGEVGLGLRVGIGLSCGSECVHNLRMQDGKSVVSGSDDETVRVSDKSAISFPIRFEFTWASSCCPELHAKGCVFDGMNLSVDQVALLEELN